MELCFVMNINAHVTKDKAPVSGQLAPRQVKTQNDTDYTSLNPMPGARCKRDSAFSNRGPTV